MEGSGWRVSGFGFWVSGAGQRTREDFGDGAGLVLGVVLRLAADVRVDPLVVLDPQPAFVLGKLDLVVVLGAPARPLLLALARLHACRMVRG